MRYRFFFIVLLCLLPAAPLAAQNAGYEWNLFRIHRFQLQSLPAGTHIPTFFENIAPDTTSLIEESNGFAVPDDPKVYFEGDSYRQFHWYWNAQDITSGLNPGAAAVRLPGAMTAALALHGAAPGDTRRGLNILTAPAGQRTWQASASTVFTNLGGISGIATSMLTPHPTDRAEDLFDSRRKIQENHVLEGFLSSGGPDSSLQLGFEYFTIQRQFNDFRKKNDSFRENADLGSLVGRYSRAVRGGRLEISAAFHDKRRDNLFAEWGRNPNETYHQQYRTVFTAINGLYSSWRWAVSYLNERERREPATPDFSKDLRDNDGEGFLPFERFGLFRSHTLRAGLEADLARSTDRRLQLYADGALQFLNGAEEHFAHNALSFGGTPYRVIRWSAAKEYTDRRLDGQAGLLLEQPLGRTLALEGRAYLRHQGWRFSQGRNNLSFLRPGFDVGLTIGRHSRNSLLLSFGREPEDLPADLAFFLENDRPAGTIYTWRDRNGDGVYQGGEEGATVGYTGAPFHRVDDNLRAPEHTRWLLVWNSRLSRLFTLTIKGVYKKTDNPLWVKFGQEYGHTETINGQSFYIFDRPYRDYVLTNGSAKSPFYAQFLLALYGGQADKWYVSFSFLAHIGMAETAFGNGLANEPGNIDESMADPNSRIHAFGRVDGDRAFVGRLTFGFQPLRRLFFSASLKYRDGNAFAFFNTLQRGEQLIIYYKTIKAEDEHGKKGGPREDYLTDINLRLAYRLRLFGAAAEISLTGTNLLDFGSELSENVFSGGSRNSVEMQIPRSVRLGISFYPEGGR